MGSPFGQGAAQVVLSAAKGGGHAAEDWVDGRGKSPKIHRITIREEVAVTTGRMPWMYRRHEDYNPNGIGAITEAKVTTALVEAGYVVLRPCFQIGRYDLVIEDEKRTLSRVQCKTGQITDGAMIFRPWSLRAAKRETGWKRVHAGYAGEIDYYGVYCPDNDKVYLLPISDVNTSCACSLRIDPPKNNQQKRIRWAKDYEVQPQRIIMPVEDLGP
jgi:hypothetical protein